MVKSRSENINSMNLGAFILVCSTHIFNWSPVVYMVGLGISVVTLFMGIKNLSQTLKMNKDKRKQYLWSAIWNVLVSVALILISLARYLN